MHLLNNYLEQIQKSEIRYYDRDLTKIKQPEVTNMYSENLRWNEHRATFPKNRAITDDILLKMVKKDRKYIQQLKIFVAEDQKKPIGSIIASIDKRKPIGYIWGLYVAENYRKGKVSNVLFNNASYWLRSNSIKEIELNIKGGNEAAVGFYKNRGYMIKTYVLRQKNSRYSDPFYHTPHVRN